MVVAGKEKERKNEREKFRNFNLSLRTFFFLLIPIAQSSEHINYGRRLKPKGCEGQLIKSDDSNRREEMKKGSMYEKNQLSFH